MNPRLSNQRSHAMTLMEVLVVIIILAVFVAMIIPAQSGPGKAKRIFCLYNLKQIGLAYRIWAGDNGDKYPMDISVTNGGTMELFRSGSRYQNLVFLNYLVMSNELQSPKILYCPADTNGFAAANFSAGFGNQNVSYFAGLDANTNYPPAFLSGDDNFEISGVPVKSGLLEISSNTPIAWTAARHKFTGNIGLVDGSVQQETSYSLRQALQQTGLATNRLAIP
jgi:prepilin-type N-terminal cleavage/methylation domain-containing protein